MLGTFHHQQTNRLVKGDQGGFGGSDGGIRCTSQFSHNKLRVSEMIPYGSSQQWIIVGHFCRQVGGVSSTRRREGSSTGTLHCRGQLVTRRAITTRNNLISEFNTLRALCIAKQVYSFVLRRLTMLPHR
jgi:hypothetical protein